MASAAVSTALPESVGPLGSLVSMLAVLAGFVWFRRRQAMRAIADRLILMGEVAADDPHATEHAARLLRSRDPIASAWGQWATGTMAMSDARFADALPPFQKGVAFAEATSQTKAVTHPLLLPMLLAGGGAAFAAIGRTNEALAIRDERRIHGLLRTGGSVARDRRYRFHAQRRPRGRALAPQGPAAGHVHQVRVRDPGAGADAAAGDMNEEDRAALQHVVRGVPHVKKRLMRRSGG